MKLAALGIIVGVMGLVAGEDGLLLTAALWVPGGLIIRLIHGPPIPKDEAATAAEVFGGRRVLATVILIAVGAASVVIGAVPIVFDGGEGWRWIPVVVGGFGAGTQLLALLMYGAGSGLQSLVGAHGDPDHPATIRLDGIEETGVRINDRPRMELSLTVSPQGRDDYSVAVKQVIGFGELGALRVGSTYHGLVDLDVPEGVQIDWHAPVDGGPGGDASADDVATRLARVDQLLNDGTITLEEHAAARRDILDDL